MIRQTTRRDFMAQTAAIGAAVWVSGQAAPAATKSPNEKLNIAAIGAGGKARADIQGCSRENIVALCDVDDERAAQTYGKYPNVPKFKDYRKMLEKRKDIEAVIVTTPDHHHAPASIMAMKLGKNVYCQKPLTHSIYEARRMREVAREMNVVTQMGNQGHAFNGSRRLVEIIRDGVIGEIRDVHCWTDRPGKYWHQPVQRPPGTKPVPATLDWDLWLGPAPTRPFPGYHVYCPHDWRAWWDFGSGALGDMACHVVDTAFWALELGSPTSAEAHAVGVTNESAPTWQIIKFQFPARESKTGGKLPPVTLTWYDGGKKPPVDLGDGGPLSPSGTVWIGEKGRIYTPSEYSITHVLLPKEKFADYKGPTPYLPRNSGGPAAPYLEWIAACKGGPMSLSNFEYASRLTESMLVGVLAVRLGKKIEWDGENMRAKNAPEADPIIKREYRKDWSV
jgi:predicted dehydrogenase